METISQVMIFLLGASGIWLVARKEDWKRWGYIVGMLAQPFWLYTSIVNEQWGVVALTAFYAYSWGMGIYNYWIKTEEKPICKFKFHNKYETSAVYKPTMKLRYKYRNIPIDLFHGKSELRLQQKWIDTEGNEEWKWVEEVDNN